MSTMLTEEVYRRTVGGNIRRIRDRLNIKQRELASMVGVSPGYITQIERNGKMPTFLLAMRIANALRINPEDLLRELPD